MSTTDAKVLVLYYSATGHVHRLAEAFIDGAADAGAEVRLRRAAELAPDSAIDANEAWRAHLDATAHVERATLDDLRWANAYALGTPTRYGNACSQLRQFLDTTAGLWSAGVFADKPTTGFTASYEQHGGQESTLLSLYNTFQHWGSVVLPTGYVDYEIVNAAGGNPYGVSLVESLADDPKYLDAVLAAARYQGARLARAASALTAFRDAA